MTITLPQLTRTWAGIELPAPGTWHLHRASFVGVTAGRRRHHLVRVLDGSIRFGEPDAEPVALRLRTDDRRVMRLLAWADDTSADLNGFGRWQLVGEVHDDATGHHGVHDHRDVRGRLDVRGELAFHGVYRRGDDVWAWLTGAVSTRSGRRPRRHDIEIVMDVVARPVG